MPRYVVQVDGKLTQQDRPCHAGDVIELPTAIAEEFGPEVVLPEGAAATPRPISGETVASLPPMPQADTEAAAAPKPGRRR